MRRINSIVRFGAGLTVLAVSLSLSSCQGSGEDAGPADSAGMEETTAPAHNVLSEEEIAAGWQLLFDGVSTDGWLVVSVCIYLWYR